MRTGKTTILQALSRKLLGREPFEVRSATDDGKWVDQKEKNIEKDFETALEFSKEHGPSILLLDEADSLARDVSDLTGSSRGHAGEKTNALQKGLDSLVGSRVLFIASTNYASSSSQLFAVDLTAFKL